MQNEKVMELDVSQSSSSKGEMHQAGDSGNLIYCVSLVFAKASIAFLLSLGTFLNYASQFKGSDEIYGTDGIQDSKAALKWKLLGRILYFLGPSHSHSQMMFQKSWFLMGITVTGSSF
ncbi:uncharacterized protein [Elaeis guineensis]|uniref:Uncharacterized protein LOC105050175 isoform X3 n=1 Tax=Elaeis guineensis var. tenera TaxID=51953 RepID=A0A6I9RKN0_ELAGV|nr:uncharacterized protein LOC105050175 isoform X3 [Elaeis guineensis]